MQITFPDSGYTITWPELPPGALDAIVSDVQQDNPKPVLTDEQLADPATIMAVTQVHTQQLMDRMERMLDQIRDRVIPLVAQHLADSIDIAGVQHMRRTMTKIGTPIDPALDDREVFLRYLCLSSFDDRHVLHQALIQLSPRLRELRREDPRWRSTEG